MGHCRFAGLHADRCVVVCDVCGVVCAGVLCALCALHARLGDVCFVLCELCQCECV